MKDLFSEKKSVAQTPKFDSSMYLVKAQWWETALAQGPSTGLNPQELVYLTAHSTTWAMALGDHFFLQPGSQLKPNSVARVDLPCLQQTQIAHREPCLARWL